MLLHNPEAAGLHTPRGEWDTVRKYDTAWRCEKGRREEAMERSEEATNEAIKRRRSPLGPHAPVDGGNTGMLAALLQYRCEHEDRGRRR